MIASQKIGKSFSGALRYNMKKMAHPNPLKRAELLDSNFSSLDAAQIIREVDLVRGLKPNLNRYVYHASLNFSNDDLLDNTQILKIAHDYLSESGYTNNQYLIFRHYDAEHPHVHLLVNRVSFDGLVVSDSNNFKKSEVILRGIEQRYGLTAVLPSGRAPQRAVTKNEVEMIDRTGRSSDKLLLQELMNRLLARKGMDMNALIAEAGKQGIDFLFNQASTGRVTGITYFYNGFKVKGQALGNRYKWAELIKTISYEQNKHGQGIGEANDRTTAKYGKQASASEVGNIESGRGSGNPAGIVTSDAVEFAGRGQNDAGYSAGPGTDPTAADADGGGNGATGGANNKIAQTASPGAEHPDHSGSDGHLSIEISDDEDDALKRRKRRTGR